MGLVRVVNQNAYPFSQDFKGDMISIPAKGQIEMNREDAIQFLAQYSPIERDHDEQPLPKSYKMLVIEEIPGQKSAEAKQVEFVCQSCRGKFASQKELDDHIDEWHLDQLADEDEKEKRLKRRGKKAGVKDVDGGDAA